MPDEDGSTCGRGGRSRAPAGRSRRALRGGGALGRGGEPRGPAPPRGRARRPGDPLVRARHRGLDPVELRPARRGDLPRPAWARPRGSARSPPPLPRGLGGRGARPARDLRPRRPGAVAGRGPHGPRRVPVRRAGRGHRRGVRLELRRLHAVRMGDRRRRGGSRAPRPRRPGAAGAVRRPARAARRAHLARPLVPDAGRAAPRRERPRARPPRELAAPPALVPAERRRPAELAHPAPLRGAPPGGLARDRREARAHGLHGALPARLPRRDAQGDPRLVGRAPRLPLRARVPVPHGGSGTSPTASPSRSSPRGSTSARGAGWARGGS